MAPGNHEGLAGTSAAVNYLAGLGAELGATFAGDFPGFTGRRLQLKATMDAVRAYERPLVGKLIKGLQAIPGVTLYGITDPFGFDRRAPTVAFTLEGTMPRQVAERLGEEGIFVRDGNYYALAVTERLGVEGSGGMVRVGIAHYNTAAEVDRLLVVVNDLAAILDNERNHLIDPTASCEERTGPASLAGPVVFGYPASWANWLYASLRGEHQVLFTSPRLVQPMHERTRIAYVEPDRARTSTDIAQPCHVLAHQVPMEHVSRDALLDASFRERHQPAPVILQRTFRSPVGLASSHEHVDEISEFQSRCPPRGNIGFEPRRIAR